MADAKQPQIVLVLGASFAGIPLAHKLLRTLPAEYQVILVNPSTHMYWNIAAPRAVASPSSYTTALFSPIVDSFTSHHPDTRFRFIQGLATAVTPASNTAEISLVTNDAPTGTGETETIAYTHLVVATGSSAIDGMPFKSVGPHTSTISAVSALHDKIDAAETIVLSGAGATGVETAGEIATLYPEKKVIILSSSPHLLPITGRADIGAVAAKTLKQLGVDVRVETKVVSEAPAVTGDDKIELKLTNGDTILADVHIPTYGLLANTSFLPPQLLDDGGWVKINAHLYSPVHDNIWAIGDAATVGNRQSVNAANMVPVAHQNIMAVVEGKGNGGMKEYKEGPLLLAVPMGHKFAKGTGMLFGWKAWGIVVWFAKGRDYMIGNFKGVASGKAMAGGAKV